MEFPAYVPAAVREHITAILEGPSSGEGMIGALKDTERRLTQIEGAIDTKTRRGEVEYLDGLRQQRAEAVRHRDGLAGEVACLRRLAHDTRMRDAYAVLTREFSDDHEWRGFIDAAWSARMDFARYRDRLKRAAALKAEIAKASATLAKLIRQFSETGIIGPGEFFSIPELLRQTENHDGRNLDMWCSMRHHILGERPDWDIPEAKPDEESHAAPTPSTVILSFVEPDERVEIDRVAQARNTLRYAWGTAPDFPALLDTVANAAWSFRPSEYGMIGAALQSRQRSPKTEYLRAFGNLLIDVHGFTLITPMLRAMAIVANVVINLPDVDVTYDDVRKALEKLPGERPENSGDK